jgi:hypothetical protein
MSRKRDLVDRSFSIEEMDQVRQRLRPVEDVQALPLADTQELDKVLPKPKPNHHGRERRAQLRLDEAGAPCACSETTACLAHHGITGRRRFVRPS